MFDELYVVLTDDGNELPSVAGVFRYRKDADEFARKVEAQREFDLRCYIEVSHLNDIEITSRDI